MRKEPLALAWVHTDTGSIVCATADLVAPAAPAKVRWPHIGKDPRLVQHLREIIAKLETPMQPNTKAAVLACLNELLRHLSSPNATDQPRAEDKR